MGMLYNVIGEAILIGVILFISIYTHSIRFLGEMLKKYKKKKKCHVFHFMTLFLIALISGHCLPFILYHTYKITFYSKLR